MASNSNSDTRRRLTPLVYLHGHDRYTDFWYSIDVDKLSQLCPSRELQVSPVARLDYRTGGSWAMLGNHIYYSGGSESIPGDRKYTCSDLIKYNTAIPNAKWQVVYKYKSLRQYRPLMFATDNHKLHVVGDNLNQLDIGEIYDIDLKSWKCLPYCHYVCATDVPALFEKDGKPTRIAFCCFHKGYVSYYDLSTRNWDTEYCHYDFALVKEEEKNGDVQAKKEKKGDVQAKKEKNGDVKFPPRGLLACRSVDLLIRAVSNVTPIVNDSTLYWCTDDLYLYGYDLLERRWYKSKCLEGELSTYPHLGSSCYYPPPTPVLVNLRNGKFLLLFVDRGKLKMATLVVRKGLYSLKVWVKLLPSLIVDSRFRPVCAKTITKFRGIRNMFADQGLKMVKHVYNPTKGVIQREHSVSQANLEKIAELATVFVKGGAKSLRRRASRQPDSRFVKWIENAGAVIIYSIIPLIIIAAATRPTKPTKPTRP